MKALIRNAGETVTEDMGITGIDWKTGMPLTNPVWAGGPYILVHDYVFEDPTCAFAATDPAPEPAQDPVVEDGAPDTIVIDGVTYTRAS